MAARKVERSDAFAGQPAVAAGAHPEAVISRGEPALLYPDRYFYHDEMYQIWNNQHLFPLLRAAQRQAAHRVLTITTNHASDNT